MPKFIDYIFNHRHYKEVLSAYNEATQRLNKAFEVWQTTINRELTDDYSTQEFIFENISSIRDIQSWMDKTNNLLSSKKQAVLWLYSDTYGRCADYHWCAALSLWEKDDASQYKLYWQWCRS